MAEAADAPRVRSKPLHGDLPDEIVIWEILVCLPPKFILRCRSVCRAWRQATSTRGFLLANHGRQPSLPIICGSEYTVSCRQKILVLDHRAANVQLQPVSRLDATFYIVASCDGLLILSKYDTGFSICNPATHQYAPLPQLSGFKLLGMYAHRPTGEYRLLLHWRSNMEPTVIHLLPKTPVGCYVFALGSDQPLRYIGAQELPFSLCCMPTALVRDSLHWFPVHQSEMVLVFSTTTESFRRMRAPVASRDSCIFETDGTLGIYSRNDAMKIVDIWVLQNNESEVWYHKYHVELSTAEFWGKVRWRDPWDVRVVSEDSDILLIVTYGAWLCYVDTDGKLVASFRRDGQGLYACQRRLKQSLVQHTFFAVLEGHTVNASPFI